MMRPSRAKEGLHEAIYIFKFDELVSGYFGMETSFRILHACSEFGRCQFRGKDRGSLKLTRSITEGIERTHLAPSMSMVQVRCDVRPPFSSSGSFQAL